MFLQLLLLIDIKILFIIKLIYRLLWMNMLSFLGYLSRFSIIPSNIIVACIIILCIVFSKEVI